jgi:fructan beta-fructosidase
MIVQKGSFISTARGPVWLLLRTSQSRRSPLVVSRPYDLKLVVDRSSIEAYAQSGTIAMTNLIFPASDISRVALFSARRKPAVVKGDIWKLRTIWE